VNKQIGITGHLKFTPGLILSDIRKANAANGSVCCIQIKPLGLIKTKPLLAFNCRLIQASMGSKILAKQCFSSLIHIKLATANIFSDTCRSTANSRHRSEECKFLYLVSAELRNKIVEMK